jgi:hypothetical protein
VIRAAVKRRRAQYNFTKREKEQNGNIGSPPRITAIPRATTARSAAKGLLLPPSPLFYGAFYIQQSLAAFYPRGPQNISGKLKIDTAARILCTHAFIYTLLFCVSGILFWWWVPLLRAPPLLHAGPG